MKYIKLIQAFLAGKKTYIVGILMVLVSLENYLTGSITLSQFLTSLTGLLGFNGLGLITTRLAIQKVEAYLTLLDKPASLKQ